MRPRAIPPCAPWNKIADLDGAEDAVATATGMAAIGTVLIYITVGSHLVASDNVYAITKELLTQNLPSFATTVALADFSGTAAVEAASTSETGALFTQTLSNPLLRVADLPAVGSGHPT